MYYIANPLTELREGEEASARERRKVSSEDDVPN